MKKIVLAIDDLRVASFETTGETGGTRGTVRGHATERCTALCTSLCAPRPTEGDPNTCQPGSCAGTCFAALTGYPCYQSC